MESYDTMHLHVQSSCENPVSIERKKRGNTAREEKT